MEATGANASPDGLEKTVPTTQTNANRVSGKAFQRNEQRLNKQISTQFSRQ